MLENGLVSSPTFVDVKDSQKPAKWCETDTDRTGRVRKL